MRKLRANMRMGTDPHSRELYCNEKKTVTNSYAVPLLPIEQELTGCTKAIVEEWEELADVYKYSKVTATMTKSKAFDLSESAVLSLISAGVGLVSAVGGIVYGLTFDQFRDVIRALDGNNVTVYVGDSYLSLGRQCIDSGIDVHLVEQ